MGGDVGEKAEGRGRERASGGRDIERMRRSIRDGRGRQGECPAAGAELFISIPWAEDRDVRLNHVAEGSAVPRPAAAVFNILHFYYWGPDGGIAPSDWSVRTATSEFAASRLTFNRPGQACSAVVYRIFYLLSKDSSIVFSNSVH